MLQRKRTIPIVELKRKKWEQKLGLFGNRLNDVDGSILSLTASLWAVRLD